MGDPNTQYGSVQRSAEEEVMHLRSELERLRVAGSQIQEELGHYKAQAAHAQGTSAPAPVRLHPAIKLPPLDKYSGRKGEDLLAWLFTAKEHFSILNINEDENRIVFAGTALTENAKTWYRSVRIEGRSMTWNEFEAALKAHFYPLDPVKHARDKLHPLMQTSSVRDYTAQFRQLAAIITNMAESEKLDRYIRGLKTRTRGHVELKEPTTFDEACRLAEMIDVTNDRIFANANANSNSSNRSNYHSVRVPRRNDPEPMDLNAISEPKEKPKFKKLTPEEKEKRRRDGLCLYCGSDKHQLDACPLRKSPGKGFQRPNRGAN